MMTFNTKSHKKLPFFVIISNDFSFVPSFFPFNLMHGQWSWIRISRFGSNLNRLTREVIIIFPSKMRQQFNANAFPIRMYSSREWSGLGRWSNRRYSGVHSLSCFWISDFSDKQKIINEEPIEILFNWIHLFFVSSLRSYSAIKSFYSEKRTEYVKK